MSAPRKRFEDHSARWQRQARKDGLDARRWNAWLKLSASTRKTTDPRQYAAGVGVSQQRTERARAAVLARFQNIFPKGRTSTMRMSIAQMNQRQLRQALTDPPSRIQSRAKRKPAPGDYNPWWYR